MKPVNNKVVVRVDPHQKDTIEIGGFAMFTANRYETNYRYKSPTIGTVVEGNEVLRSGDVLLLHHNLCFLPSPYHLYDDLFSVPYSKVLFAKILISGDIEPICGNLICEEIEIESTLEIPDDLKKVYLTKYKVINPGWTKQKEGDIIFTRPSSGYNIIYNWEGKERKVLKVSQDMICGFVRKK